MAKIRIFKPQDDGPKHMFRVLTGLPRLDEMLSKVQPCSGPDCILCRVGRETYELLNKKGKVK